MYSLDSSTTSFIAPTKLLACSANAPPANAPANDSDIPFAESLTSSKSFAVSFASSPSFLRPVTASLTPESISDKAVSFSFISRVNLLIYVVVSFAPTFNLSTFAACLL